MIKVVFKEKYGNYGETEYTYSDKDFANIEIGDEVVVDTRYGYALAKVTQVNVEDSRFSEDELKVIKMIVETAKEKEDKLKKEQERKANLKRIEKEARKQRFLDKLEKLVNAEDYEKYVVDMTLNELEELFNALTETRVNSYNNLTKTSGSDLSLKIKDCNYDYNNNEWTIKF